jgi:hypothetical protein
MTLPGDRVSITFAGDTQPTPATVRSLFNLARLPRRYTNDELLGILHSQAAIDALAATDPQRFTNADPSPDSWIGFARDDQPGYISPANLATWGVVDWAILQTDTLARPTPWQCNGAVAMTRQIRLGTYAFPALRCADGTWRDPDGRPFTLTSRSQPALGRAQAWPLEDGQPPLGWMENPADMTPNSLGRINVATPGTPQRLAAASTPCSRIRVQVVAGLSGKMYFGTAACNHSTLAGVIKELWPNSGGGISDSYEVWSADGTDSIDLSQYAIDASIAGEGLIVSYWVG